MGIQVVVGKVYKRKELEEYKYSPNRELNSTIQIKSSSITDSVDNLSGVEIFVSNQPSKPANSSEMENTDIVFNGIYTLESRTTWICFELVNNSDSYSIYSEGVIPDVSNSREAIFNGDSE